MQAWVAKLELPVRVSRWYDTAAAPAPQAIFLFKQLKQPKSSECNATPPGLWLLPALPVTDMACMAGCRQGHVPAGPERLEAAGAFPTRSRCAQGNPALPCFTSKGRPLRQAHSAVARNTVVCAQYRGVCTPHVRNLRSWCQAAQKAFHVAQLRAVAGWLRQQVQANVLCMCVVCGMAHSVVHSTASVGPLVHIPVVTCPQLLAAAGLEPPRHPAVHRLL